MMGQGTPRLELTGIVKRYPGCLANDHVDLTVMPGEIHALLGENGAGKSTLVKIIYGVVKADAGEIVWQGRPVAIPDPNAARALGIGMVFQHFNLFETLTVAENISLGLDGRHDLAALGAGIAAVSGRYGLPVDPARHVHSLSVGERQRVEIVRCLLQEPKLMIMDEPTSVLTPGEVARLFETLKRLAAEGCSILYISHKLDEIRQLCHAATVLRQGRVTARCDPRRETPASLAGMMIGSELPVCHRAGAPPPGEVRLAVDGLTLTSPDPHGTSLDNIRFTVRRGEIFGIAGVSGNGQKELLAALNGELLAPAAAAIALDGVPVGRLGPAARRRLGLAFVPEERLGRGTVPGMSLARNALLTAWGRGLLGRGFIRHAATQAYASDVIGRFAVRAGGVEAEARSLSGGNLQKFIVGREMMQAPRLLVLGHPTWGVDVGAATAIRQALVDMANDGTSVVVVSEDLDELFEICDTLAVIAGGRLSPARPVAATSVEEVGLWMSGRFASAPAEPAHA